jgi:hypothetical protein
VHLVLFFTGRRKRRKKKERRREEGLAGRPRGPIILP